MAANDFHPLLRQLITQYEWLGMFLLGKVPDPATGKTQRELPQVREVIRFLEMLETKTRGNLTHGEETELRRVLTLLRLNYVEESRKPEPAEAGAAPGAVEQTEAGKSGAEQAEPAAPAAPQGTAQKAGAAKEKPAGEADAGGGGPRR